MIEEKKYIGLIEGYLQNKLSASELEDFEELLIKDEDFGQLFIDQVGIFAYAFRNDVTVVFGFFSFVGNPLVVFQCKMPVSDIGFNIAFWY